MKVWLKINLFLLQSFSKKNHHSIKKIRTQFHDCFLKLNSYKNFHQNHHTSFKNQQKTTTKKCVKTLAHLFLSNKIKNKPISHHFITWDLWRWRLERLATWLHATQIIIIVIINVIEWFGNLKRVVLLYKIVLIKIHKWWNDRTSHDSGIFFLFIDRGVKMLQVNIFF